MSKVLKFIVHFVIICTILCVLAMALPPFFGVTTVIMDDRDKATNLPMGSVTYAIPVKTSEIQAGAPILVNEDSKVYRYNIATLNLDNGTGTVIDPTVSASQAITVAVKNSVPKVVITIGYIGYLLVATKSMEGMMIIGLVILFLIILYVIAELWKREPASGEEDEGEEEEDVPVKSVKELKREEKEREKRLKEEDKQFLKSEKQKKKQERKNKKIIKTGGFVDEIYEEDLEPGGEGEEAPEEKPEDSVQTATSEAHELLKKEIAAATAETPEAEAKEPEQQPEPEEKQQSEPQEEKAPAETLKMAIPRWTAAQLAAKAKKAGDSPDIVRDDITKITLFDYSDIIAGNDGSEEE